MTTNSRAGAVRSGLGTTNQHQRTGFSPEVHDALEHAPSSPLEQYIVTTDARRAILYRCHPIPGGRVHVDELRTLTNIDADSVEIHRPSLLGRGPSANAAQHFADQSRHDEEVLRRFARRTADWLGKASKELPMAAVNVFATPRFFSVLRDECGAGGVVADMVERELTHLRPTELAEHPAVRAVLPWTR